MLIILIYLIYGQLDTTTLNIMVCLHMFMPLKKDFLPMQGGWYELVNKETTGVVGTGTETYHIGNLNVTGITTLGSIGISTGLITGPAVTYIDPATVGDNTGTLVVKGNLQVDGTQTTVNSSTMTVTDKNIELAKGAANDAAADGGGITVASGGGDKTWQWLDATDSWTSSEHIRIADDKVFGWVMIQILLLVDHLLIQSHLQMVVVKKFASTQVVLVSEILLLKMYSTYNW